MRHVALVSLAAASAYAGSEATFNGVSLHGMTSITNSSAIGSYGTNGINALTDNTWSTGDFALGDTTLVAPGSVLAGEFGSTYTSTGRYVYVIAPAMLRTLVDGHTANLGGFELSILLGNNQYVSAGTFSDANFTLTTESLAGSTYYAFFGAYTISSGDSAVAQFLAVDIGALDTQGLGIKGVKLSNFTSLYLDLGYVGISDPSPVPEPSTYGLMLGGLALAAVAVRRRAKK